ncbi:MAG: hypothetical protein WB780_16210 [Candidatus Acidiferrales bacterium]
MPSIDKSEEPAGASSPDTNTRALVLTARFFREYPLGFVAISLFILTPCFWHRRIEAGDLASHLYNAWLAHLIERGQVHGLVIATQWTNVLFDYLLSALARFFSMNVVEKVSASLAVSIFFWGAFALISAAIRRPPWHLVPLIAMVTYGWTFQMGFFNYYISLGLSFFGIVVFWRGRGYERLLPIALAPFILLAHPLGLAWLGAAAFYIAIGERIPRRLQFLWLLTAAAALAIVHFYLQRHFVVDTETDPLYFFTGADQFVLFGARYKITQVAFLVFVFTAILLDAMHRRRERGLWDAYRMPLELYVIVELGVILLPDGIRFPGPPSALALLTERLTSVSAVLLCCLLGAMQPRRWHLIVGTGIAALFFTFLYQDTATLNRMEVQAERLVRTVPPGQRILATIQRLPGSRVLIQHMIDRACIGYCFSYGNYEPTSGMFRVRALPGNPYCMTEPDSAADMEDGTYEVAAEDLPAYQVYQCSMAGTDLCIRPLEAGEDNDRLGIHPPEP